MRTTNLDGGGDDSAAAGRRRKITVGIVVAAALLAGAVAAGLLLRGRGDVGAGGDKFSTSGGGASPTYDAAFDSDRAAGSFLARPESVRPGGKVELEWDVPGAKGVRIDGVEGTFGPRGRHILAALDERVMAATGGGGEAADSHAFTMRATMQEGSERVLTAGVKLGGGPPGPKSK